MRKSIWIQKNLLSVLTVALSIVVTMPLAKAVGPVPVTNQGFELPGTVKTWFHTGGAANTDIPGWTASGPGGETCCGTLMGDSGVESGGSQGAWQGFLNAVDPSIYQTTGYVMPGGEGFTLTVAARNIYSSDVYFGANVPDTVWLRSTLYYWDGANRVPFASTDSSVAEGWTDYALTVPAGLVPGAAIGLPLGIEFDNVRDVVHGPGPSWIALDNVRLEAVPEPATASLLLLSSVGLLFNRKQW
jgi:hypothetical protein